MNLKHEKPKQSQKQIRVTFMVIFLDVLFAFVILQGDRAALIVSKLKGACAVMHFGVYEIGFHDKKMTS